ncbi:MAG: PLP-dependent aminotransferase family protein [Flaviaesturariibacter sp.]|nr:PLP-dependent aminotransferase family protein [Flaviaesturariibacter sp.]
MKTVHKKHKYLQIAEKIEELINDETLKIGEKLPSIRTVSTEQGISMGTAFQAYYNLEAKGLIETRPKSGYYVRLNNVRFPSLPKAHPLEPIVNEGSVQEMIDAVFKHLGTKDLINFSIGSPSMTLLPVAKLTKSIVHAFRSSPHNCIAYEDIQGNPELRKQIAKLSFNWGGRTKPDDVVVTSGCMKALVMCLKAVTNIGDVVAIESPTFFGIFQLIQSLGLKTIEITTDPFEGIDLKYLEKTIKKFKVKACVFVTNFNNPLGSCMPDNKKKELVEVLAKYQLPLIEDDIYGELYYGKQRPKTCKSYDTEGLVLYCSSFSKSLAPGYRVGWCIPGKFTDKVKQLKQIHTVASTTITQVAIAHFLQIGRFEYHLRSLRKSLHTQCFRYTQAILAYFPKDIKVSRPKGGFVLWIELHVNVNSFDLCQRAIRQGISIAPGRIFSADEKYRNYLRIAIAGLMIRT